MEKFQNIVFGNKTQVFITANMAGKTFAYLPSAYQLIPLQWDEFLVNKALISKMGLIDHH